MRTDVPDWLKDRYVIRESGPGVAIVRRDFLSVFDDHRLLDAAGTSLHVERAPARDRESPAETGLTGGRGEVRLLQAGALGEAVIRPYRRGGLPGRFLRQRYLAGSRAFHELALTARLRDLGAPVPEVLAAIQVRQAPGYTAQFITRRIVGALPAGAVLQGASVADATPVMDGMGRSARRVHRAGGWHADLNANNFLVAAARVDVPAIIIDFDRGRYWTRGVPTLLVKGNLRRLRRSLRKLGLTGALAAWDALLEGYASEPEPPAAA
jgi:3-deoxy-D-manno-octulosonic acid kinase